MASRREAVAIGNGARPWRGFQWWIRVLEEKTIAIPDIAVTEEIFRRCRELWPQNAWCGGGK